MAYMIGKTFFEETFVGAQPALLEEFVMPDNAPGSQAQYCMTLVARCMLQDCCSHSIVVASVVTHSVHSLSPPLNRAAFCTSFTCTASAN
jgi:hypothetical protein